MSYHSFEELEVWKRSSNLMIEIFKLFKNSKEFAFRDQIVRSALSISSNIAEGCERNSNILKLLIYTQTPWPSPPRWADRHRPCDKTLFQSTRNGLSARLPFF